MEENKEYKEIKTYSDAEKQEFISKLGERNIVEVPVYTQDNYKFIYLVRRPSKAVIQAIAELENKPESQKQAKDITSIQNLMEGCVLSGDKQAYENDASIFTVLMKEIGGLLHQSKSDLKK